MHPLLNEKLIDEFILANSFSKKTIEGYKSDIKQFLKYNAENAHNVISFNLRKYFDSLISSKRTKKRKYASLDRYFDYLKKKEHTQHNILRLLEIKITLPNTISFSSISDEKIVTLRKYLIQDSKYKQYNLILNLVLDTGLSVHSILKHTTNSLEHLFIASDCIISSYTKNAKIEYLHSIGDKDLFINRNGNKLTEQSVKNFFAKINKELGLSIKYSHLVNHYIEHQYLDFIEELSNEVGLSQRTLMEKLTLYNKRKSSY